MNDEREVDCRRMVAAVDEGFRNIHRRDVVRHFGIIENDFVERVRFVFEVIVVTRRHALM